MVREQGDEMDTASPGGAEVAEANDTATDNGTNGEAKGLGAAGARKSGAKSITPTVNPFDGRTNQTFVDSSQHYIRRPRSLMECFLNAFYIQHQFDYDDIAQLQEE